MIKDIQELNFPSYATMSAATVLKPDMGGWNITSQIKIDGQIAPDFSFDWEVVHDGHKYIMPLRIPAGSKDNQKPPSVIDLTFQHWAIWQLKRFPFVTMQPIDSGTAVADEEVATVSLNLGDLVILFGQVLKYYYGDKITIQLNPDWQYKAEAEVITISHTKVWNVLIDTFQPKYGVRWAIEPNGNYDKYVIKIGYPTTEQSHIFEYGFEGGLMKVERQVQSEEICNLLKGRGGEKNLPYRYFKDVDPENDTFKADPDWIEELANIYFANLMPATFRSYVQGWKAAHLDATDSEGNLLYEGYEPVGEDNAYAPWAYRKGFTDTKFHPVEFVADEITLNPEEGDRQVEILPGYSPFVKKGSSLDKYGALMNSLDNNEDIYPTIQGVTVDPYGRIDEAVYVEQIESDDVVEAVESDAQPTTIEGATTARKSEEMARETITVDFPEFTVEKDKTATLVPGVTTIEAFFINFLGKEEYISDSIVLKSSPIIAVTNVETNQSHSASGIPEGRWKWSATFDVEVDWESGLQHSKQQVLVTVGYESPKLIQSTLSDKWTNTFDILVKNIWGTTKLATETNEQYAKRVWEPILGDRVGNEAKMVFASGMLSISKDYEFIIVDIPKFEQKTCKWQTVEGGDIVNHEYLSEWRITLAKSDADLETLGTYVPSKTRQGKAGDYFFFIGIDMPHQYTVWNEIRIDDDWKKPILGEKKDIKPTWVVQTDRVRLNNEGKPDALIRQLHPGDTLRLADKRFIEGAFETLYLSSLTITYREPTKDDAALNPDVEIVLSDRYEVSANPVATLQGEVEALTKQVGAISNIEQIVRAVGDKLYLRKDGIADRSLSPTEFASLLTSMGFRSGIVGGAGWGIYKDANGNWVFEADRLIARNDLEVNSLVINQVTGQGGTVVESAARMEVTRVEEFDNGYKCYFDQKNGSVANLFHVDDIAWNNRYTPENTDLKFYRRRVTEVGADYVVLSKTDVNGTGIPSEGDVIVQSGNYTDANRQYIKVRDVIGGGYERYIENLDSVDAEGTEYYFVGRTNGQLPRWFIGNRDIIPGSGLNDGSFIEYYNRQFNLNNVTLSVGSKIGDKTLGDIIQGIDASKYLREALNQSTIVDNGLVLTSAILLGRTNQIGERETWAGHNGLYNNPKTIASFWGGDMVDRYYDENGIERTTPLATGFAASLIRMDGSGYFSKGAFSWDAIGNPKFGSGVKVVLGDASEVDLSASVTSFFNFIANLSKAFVPAKIENGVEQPLPWTAIDEAQYIKALYTISSVGDLQAFGYSDTTGGSASALADLVDVTLTNPSKGQSIVFDGTHWVNQVVNSLNETQLLAYLTNNNYAKKSDIPSLSGYATQQWVEGKGYLTAVAWGDVTGKPTWIGATKPSYDFSEIGSKPTTIAGYGITDAKIANGVITLGTNTITPLVSADIKTLTFQSGAFSAKTYTPNSAATTVNIPTTTSHISEGTRLYFTDARAQSALATTVANINAAIGLKLDKSLFDKLFTVVYDTDGTTVLYVKSPYTFVSEKDLQAFGYGATSGGSGSAINILSSWANYGDSTKGYALSAELGYDLRTRIATLEGKNYLDALTLTTSGSGNAVTAVALSADKKTLSVTKGTTFLTSHQAIRTLTIQKNGTTVDTFNPTATANKTINITDVASAATLSSHIGNTTMHITADERTLWNTTATNLSAILGSDTDNVINKYEEIVAFLDTYTEADTLANLLSNKADKTTQIIAGTGLSGGGTLAQNRTLSLATSGVTAGTYTKLTVDAYGRATAGATLSASDIPSLDWSKIATGKPTTLAGYGITDAYTKTESNSLFAPKVVYQAGSGCLVKLKAPDNKATMVTLLIEGNSYSSTHLPIKTSVQFYNYPPENVILNSSATHYGRDFGTINAFNLDGYIYVWFKQATNYTTFAVTAICSATGGLTGNAVDTITNEAMPTSGVTRLVTITPKIAAMQDWVNTQLDTKVSKSGDTMTGPLVITTTADAALHLKMKQNGGQASGVHYFDANGRVAGIGYYAGMTDGVATPNWAFIGWGTSPWEAANCLAVAENKFTYKNQRVLHAGYYATVLDTRYLKKADFDDLFVKVTDSNGTYIRAKYTVVSDYDLQAFGASSSSGGSGSANINMLTSWANYNASTEGYVPTAKLVYDSLALKLEASDLNGYAKQTWVDSQGFLKSITKAQVEAVLTGNITSHTHTSIVSHGLLNPQTGRTQALGDVYTYNTAGNQTGAPAIWTSVIGFGRGTMGTVEIAGGWTSSMGLWYRSLRDSIDDWFGWRKLLDSVNTYISGGVITINGSSITPVTSLANYYTKTEADGKYVTLSTAQTITGAKTFNAILTISPTNASGIQDGLVLHDKGGGVSEGLRIRWTSASYTDGITLTGNPSANMITSSAEFSAQSFIKSGGTSSQFLKADGSVDSNTYLTTGAAASTYLKLSGGSMANTNLVTNLNADMVDGKHNGELTALNLKQTILAENDDLNNFKESGLYVTKSTLVCLSLVNAPDNRYNGELWLEVIKIVDNQGSQILYTRNSTSFKIFTRTFNAASWGAWKEFAFTDSTVSAATKLATSRKIWGQNFNGEANVSGRWELNGVASGSLSIFDGTDYRAIQSYGSKPLCLNPIGNNVAIGKTTADHKLDVNGTAKVTSLKIGSITLTDGGGYLLVDKTIVSSADIQAFGASSTSGGSGSAVFNLLSSWSGTYDNNYALAASLGVNLNQRLTSVEGSYLSTAAAATLYQPKGNYLTSHQPLDYINVKDIRATSPKPSDFAEKKVSAWFNNQDKPSTASTWYSGLTVHGWTSASYAAWELAAVSGTTVADKNLYFRVGISETWEDWQTVLTSANYATTLNSAYVKTDGSNGTAAGVTALINKLPEAAASLTDATLIVTSHSTTPDGNSYYRRPATYLWGYVQGKADSRYYTQTQVNTKLADGSVTKLGTATVGSTTKPIYLNAGVPTASTSTIGSTSKPLYMNGGTLTACSATVGASNIPVYMSGGTITAVTSIAEAYLSWGGKSISGNISPIDCAASNLHSANRLAFANPDGIKIEYTRNGTTWGQVLATDEQKTKLVSGLGNSFYIGSSTSGITLNDKLRVTLNASAMGVYTAARKLLMNISTNGATGCKVLVETSTIGAITTFTTLGTYDISGYSGWNSIPLNISFGGSASQTSQIGAIRLTFSIGALNTNTSYTNALSLSDLIIIGNTYWSTPSSMAKTGHLYTYDWQKNATFPGKIAAESLAITNGMTLGGSLTVNGGLTVSGTTLLSSVTSFTLTSKEIFRYGGTSSNYVSFEPQSNGNLILYSGNPRGTIATFEAANQQLALYKIWVGTSLSLDAAAKIYGSPAIATGEHYWFDHNRTKGMHYDSATGVFRLNGTLVVDGDVQAFGASTPGSKIKRMTVSGNSITDNRTLTIPTDVTDVIVDISGDGPVITLALSGSTAQMDIIRIYVYDRGIGGSDWKYGNKTIAVASGKAKMMMLVRYDNGIVLTE